MAENTENKNLIDLQRLERNNSHIKKRLEEQDGKLSELSSEVDELDNKTNCIEYIFDESEDAIEITTNNGSVVISVTEEETNIQNDFKVNGKKVLTEGIGIEKESASDSNEEIIFGEENDPTAIVTNGVFKVKKITDINGVEYQKLQKKILYLPQTLHAVDGDVLQIFKYAVLPSGQGKERLTFKSPYCRSYERFAQLEDLPIGSSQMVARLYDNNIDYFEKTVNVVSSSPVNPSNPVNILLIGSSTTSNYKSYYDELYRRLCTTSGDGTPMNPKGKGLTNIHFVGQYQTPSGNMRYEAVGGFGYGNIFPTNTTSLKQNYAFIVDNANAFVVGNSYICEGHSFEVYEISSSDNRVSARSDGYYELPSSGMLGGYSYTSVTATNSHPFVNPSTKEIDMNWYADTYCNGAAIDIVVLQDLIFNNGGLFSSVKDNLDLGISKIRSAYPNAKIIISTEELPNMNGIATNYTSNGVIGDATLISERLRKLSCDMDEYVRQKNNEFGSEVCVFCPKTIECDAEFDYPTEDVYVANRNSSKTPRGSNGMHPDGSKIYHQIDAYYRSICYVIGKFFNN